MSLKTIVYLESCNVEAFMLDRYPEDACIVDRDTMRKNSRGDYDYLSTCSTQEAVAFMREKFDDSSLQIYKEMWILRNLVLSQREIPFGDLMTNKGLFRSIADTRRSWSQSAKYYADCIPWEIDVALCRFHGDFFVDHDVLGFVPKVVDTPVEEPLHCHPPVDLPDSNYGYTPVFFLEDVRGECDYAPPSESLDKRHAGQLKNMFNLLDFLSHNAIPGDKVLLYGSAPGYAIAEIIKILPQYEFTCVDDYPVAYVPGVHYFSFSSFLAFLDSGDSPKYDLLYYDWYDSSLHDHYRSDFMEDLCVKVSPRVYNLKRFVTPDGILRMFPGSKARLQIFPSASSLEVREWGSGFDSSFQVSGRGIHFYNRYIRARRGHYIDSLDCSCYDCNMADFIIYEAASLLGTPSVADLYGALRESIKTFPSPKDLVRLTFSSKYEVRDSLCYSEWFVFSPLVEESLRKYASESVGYVAVDKSLLDPVPRIERPPAFALFGEGRYILLPAVTETQAGKRRYFKFPGDPRDYSDSDEMMLFPCLSCGSASSFSSIPARYYLARFRPAALGCSACGLDLSITYSDIDLGSLDVH